jgi:uncharacterized protein (DUF924 family)
MHDEVLDFWFGAVGSECYGETREIWFRKDVDFDAIVRRRFAHVIESALIGGHRDWATTPRGSLARIVLLDQFTRNTFRDSPRAFAGDTMALATADAAIGRQYDSSLVAVERWFMYLPFTHAESMPAQQRAIDLFTRLSNDAGLTDPLVWARRHASVVQAFGRFPHRNAVLGRQSTPAEIAFLAKPGSRF